VKILLGSHHFFPSTGGIETASNLLAREFIELGHEVHLITQTPGNGHFPFAIVRRPGATELFREVRWCDVFLQNNISLQTVWPLLFVRRPLFNIHQTWITGPDGRVHWPHRLKRFLLRFATSFAISRAIADELPVASQLIGNPYDDKVFVGTESGVRDRELIFVGRLVSDKGADLLLEAMARLKTEPTLTIAGEGPEHANLQKKARDLHLESRIDFVGLQSGTQLAALLRRHQILVVPSRWREPFGIVALEGIACGCVVVGSREGGLAEAIGRCGVTFPNGDAAALAAAIDSLLADPQACHRLRTHASAHLARFTPRSVATACLESMTKALS
jgi:glycogen(starch) synthase